MATRTLQVLITGDTKSLNRALGKLESSAGHAGKAAARGLALAGAAAGGALVVGLKKSVDAFAEAEKVGAQTNAVLKSTGSAANVTARQVGSLATAISLKSGMDDEAIQSAENLLLTFTRVRNEAGRGNDVFNQTTMAAADMATALGTDAKSAAMQLGKALNDPEKGVTRLMRSGVTFTQRQKDQIKTLQDSGRALDAQKIILREVNKEFGGSAKAAGDTFSGSINKAKVAVGNLGEAVGGALAPALAKGANKLAQFVTGLVNDDRPAKFFHNIKTAGTGAFSVIGPAARTAVTVVGRALRAGIEAVKNFRRDNKATINDVVTAFQSLARFAKRVFEGVLVPVIRAVLPPIKRTLGAIVDIVRGVIAIVSGLITGRWDRVWAGAKQVVSGAVSGIKNILEAGIKGIAVIALKIGKAIVGGIVKGIKSVASSISKALGGAVNLGGGTAGMGDVTARIGKNLVAAQGGAMRGAGGGGNTGGLQKEAKAGFSFLQSKVGGLRLSSGWRSAQHNAAVGGAPNSDHITGLATDIVPTEGWTPGGIGRLDKIAAWARQSPLIRWIGWRGVPGHGPGDHLHLSWADRVAGDVTARTPGRTAGGGARAFGGRVNGIGDVVGTAITNAKTVARVGTRLKASPKEMLAAIMTILVEANGLNVAHGDRDSEGAFQQRPSQGWGPASESLATDAGQFFRAAQKANRSGINAGQLAQAVQRSAFPARYNERRNSAADLLARVMVTSRAAPRAKAKPVAGRVGAGKGGLGSLLAPSMEQQLADIDLREARGGETVETVDKRLVVLRARLAKIRGDLKSGKVKNPDTRLRLTQEMASILTDKSGLGTRRAELLRGPDVEEQGESEAQRANREAVEAQTAAIQAAAEEAQRQHDERMAAEQQRHDAEVTLAAEMKRQTDFAGEVMKTENFTLVRGMSEILSSHIVGSGLAGRALMPGYGAVARY